MFSHITQDFLRNRQSRAISLAFISVGILFGSWATFIPFIKQKFGFSDAELGVLLLSMPFGSLIANPVGALLVNKLGMQKATLFGMAFMAFSFMIPLNSPFIPLLSIGLFFCGSGITIVNVAMNTCVNAIERVQNVNIMSTCHGMFSIGLMFGSLLASFAKGLLLLPGNYIIGVASTVILGMLFIRKTVLNITDEDHEVVEETSKFTMPKGPLLIMIIISICINMTEGTMADWTAVYMREIVNANPYFIGWGLVGYSLFMAIGRFLGDKIIPIFGSNQILVYGGVLALLGISLSLLLPYTISAIIGFAMVGAGVSCGAPILYASAARVPGLKKGSGLAVMNTFAMGGFLFGPVIIGFISNAIGLTLALSVLCVLATIWILFSRNVKLF
jgi:predicted MFS family arabinose efflux permease